MQFSDFKKFTGQAEFNDYEKSDGFAAIARCEIG